MAFSYDTAMLFWSTVALPPLATSIIYFRLSPSSESLARRLMVSAHGCVIATLYLSAVLIGHFGTPRQDYAALFTPICWIPALLIAYSLWNFKGHKATHLLQTINLGALTLTYVFGSMAISGVWP